MAYIDADLTPLHSALSGAAFSLTIVQACAPMPLSSPATAPVAFAQMSLTGGGSDVHGLASASWIGCAILAAAFWHSESTCSRAVSTA